MTEKQNSIPSEVVENTPDPTQALDAGRRELLKKLGKSATLAPVSLALVSMEAKACSFSC